MSSTMRQLLRQPSRTVQEISMRSYALSSSLRRCFGSTSQPQAVERGPAAQQRLGSGLEDTAPGRSENQQRKQINNGYHSPSLSATSSSAGGSKQGDGHAMKTNNGKNKPWAQGKQPLLPYSQRRHFERYIRLLISEAKSQTGAELSHLHAYRLWPKSFMKHFAKKLMEKWQEQQYTSVGGDYSCIPVVEQNDEDDHQRRMMTLEKKFDMRLQEKIVQNAIREVIREWKKTAVLPKAGRQGRSRTSSSPQGRHDDTEALSVVARANRPLRGGDGSTSEQLNASWKGKHKDPEKAFEVRLRDAASRALNENDPEKHDVEEDAEEAEDANKDSHDLQQQSKNDSLQKYQAESDQVQKLRMKQFEVAANRRKREGIEEGCDLDEEIRQDHGDTADQQLNQAASTQKHSMAEKMTDLWLQTKREYQDVNLSIGQAAFGAKPSPPSRIGAFNPQHSGGNFYMFPLPQSGLHGAERKSNNTSKEKLDKQESIASLLTKVGDDSST
ncbi:unnamed protein product [Amoebophrya sp. A25]|nr:unnamed protein product [Amoebophrya sp. A25]|eukprot:GSA25T00019062001.1